MKFYKDVLGMEVKQQTEDWLEFSSRELYLPYTQQTIKRIDKKY
jgi:ribosomal 30S subunit maturation factor RimM